METKPYQNRVNKRPNENSHVNWPKKKPSRCSNLIGNGVEKAYKFRVLLPNGASLGLKIVDPVGDKMAVVGFAEKVKEEYSRESKKYRREINWKSPDLCFVDAFENKIANVFDFKNFEPNKLYILRLHVSFISVFSVSVVFFLLLIFGFCPFVYLTTNPYI